MTSSTNIKLSAIHRKGRELFPDGLNSDGACTESYHVPNRGHVLSLIASRTQHKNPVAIAYDENVDIATGGQVVENWTDSAGNAQSYTPDIGARALLYGQTDATENGIYTVNAGAWTRTEDADSAEDFPIGVRVLVRFGEFAGRDYMIGTGLPVVGTDDITFAVTGASASDAIDSAFDATNVTNFTGTNVQEALESVDAAFVAADWNNSIAIANLTTTVTDADTVLTNAVNQVAADLATEIAATNDDVTALTQSVTAEATARQTAVAAVEAAATARRQDATITIPADGDESITLSQNLLPASFEVYQVDLVNNKQVSIKDTVPVEFINDVNGVVTSMKLMNEDSTDLNVKVVIKF